MPFEPRCEPAAGVRPVPVDPTGRRGPTKGQSAGPHWRRAGFNAYLPASLDPALPEQRITEAAYRLPPGGAVTGWAALLLSGAAYFDGTGRDGRTPQPVPLAAGTGRGDRTNQALTWTYEPFTADEVVQLGPNPVLWPRRALFDEMRRVTDWRQAVVAMDMAAAAEVVSVKRLETYAASLGRYRRSRRVHEAIPYASERSRSPKESELRLVWVLDARLPAPAVNQPIYDAAGRLICIADLFDEEAGLVIEYDGEDHRSMRRHHRDVHREGACRRADLEYCKVTAPDLRHTERLVDRLHTSRRRARFAAPSRRAWTTAPRPGEFHESLDERLDRLEWRSQELWRTHGQRLLPW